MTATELKNLMRSTLVAQRTIAQEYTALDAIIDFITNSSTNSIPEWTALLTFNTDGTGAGTYAVWPDTNGWLRFWKTKTSANTANQPPTNPATTEDTHWIEVSPSSGSGIQEWAAGVYGSGLVIVFYNHPSTGPAFYLLVEAVRPFNSTNIETEITADSWYRLGDVPSTAGSLILCGAHNSSGDNYPSTGGTGVAGAVVKGNIFISDGSGTSGTQFGEAGAWFIALVDTPAQTPANWQILYPFNP